MTREKIVDGLHEAIRFAKGGKNSDSAPEDIHAFLDRAYRETGGVAPALKKAYAFYLENYHGDAAPLPAPANSVTDEELKQIIYANQGSRLKAWIPNNKMTWHNALMCMQAALSAKVRG